MPITVSDGLKAAAVNKRGSVPISKLEIFPVSGSISTSKGLTRRIYSGFYPIAGDDDLLWTDNAGGIYAYQWGGAPPLGITPAMLSDNQTWSIRWDGYLKCTRPAGAAQVSYRIGYVGTGHVVVSTGSNAIDDDTGTVLGEGTSPHSINDLGQAVLVSSEVLWLPITVWYSRSGVSNRVLANERFVLFYKDSIDNEWKVMGSDVTCPVGGRFLNRVGTPIASVNAALQSPTQNVYSLILHELGGTYHFHKSTDMATEFPVVPGNTTTYVLETMAQNDFITITWSSTIAHEDLVDVQLIAKEETPWNVPTMDMVVETHAEAAGTLKFKTGVTKVEFDESNVSRTNFSTYDINTDSFGIIRQNRLVKAYMGYMVDGQPEYVLRFTGQIQDIKPAHEGDSVVLTVTCIDPRVVCVAAPASKIEDMMIGGIPNELSYDMAEYYPENISALGGDGEVRPPAFDRWSLAKMVRTVLYMGGFNSTQLWAKDDNDNFLIDDRGIYLEATRAYPFRVTSILGARQNKYKIEQEVLHDNEENEFGGLSFYTPKLIYNVGKWLWGEVAGGISAVKRKVSPEMETINKWEELADAEDMPYLYTFGMEEAPWEKLRNLCGSYGLALGVNADGNVYMRYPDNPVLYSSEERDETPFLSYGIGWSATDDAEAIANTRANTSTDGAWTLINFTGVGIKLVLPRFDTTAKVTAYIDNVLVDGVAELDATTGDTGHTDWTDNLVMPGAWVDLDFDSLPNGVSTWYYRDGIHPDLGKNPTAFTVCDNLTYGNHSLKVQNFSGTIYLEGFQVIATSIEQPEHEFDAAENLLGVSPNSSLKALANDVIVAGNMRGAAGDYILSRSVDMASINDVYAPNYVGVRNPVFLADPRITNQERADWLAQLLLLRYRRGERLPVCQSPGLPWLEPSDPVTIRGMHTLADGSLVPTVGMYAPGDLNKAQRTGALGVLPMPFQRYYVTQTSERMTTQGDTPKYTSTITTTAAPPMPAYEPVPEPTQSESVTAVTEINITFDSGAATYNPFLSDSNGQFINVQFNLNWHARLLNVSIVAAEADIDKPGGDKLIRGQVVNVLLSNTGFVSAGYFNLQWDGWIEGENGGMFAPDGIYSVRIETERYSTGAGFRCRAESGYPGVVSGSEQYIEILQDRDASYGADPFSVVLTPSAAPSSPPILYDLETNDGRGLRIDITLACPAQVQIPIKIRYTNDSSVPGEDLAADFAQETWLLYRRGDESPILEPGTYTFYFNPFVHVVKNGRNVLPFGTTRTIDAHVDHMIRQKTHSPLGNWQAAWYVAWHFSFPQGIVCVDKSGNTNFVQPANPTWKEYNWGGARSTSHAQVEVDDANVTWLYLDVKAAL